jgi:hypothetical protein
MRFVKRALGVYVNTFIKRKYISLHYQNPVNELQSTGVSVSHEPNLLRGSPLSTVNCRNFNGRTIINY